MSQILKNKRVLVIDDFPDMRTMVKEMLSRIGVRDVKLVVDGKDAITNLRLSDYDIVLCDYNLGDGQNGQQVLEEAQRDGLISYSTIFIIITAESSKEIVMSAVESEPDDYLAKPFNKDLLKTRLERIARRKSNIEAISRCVRQDEFHKAIQVCDMLLDKEPKNRHQIQRIKATLLKKIGDPVGADKLYQEVLAEDSLSWAEFGHGLILFERGDYTKAKESFTQLLRLHPTYIAAYDWIAKIDEAQDNVDNAKELLEQAIELSPNIVSRQKQFGQLSYKTGELSNAHGAFTKVIKLARNSIHDSGENEADLANVLLDQGDSIGALKLINAAKKRFRHKPESMIELSLSEHRVQTANGNQGLADQALSNARKFYQNLPAPVALGITVKLSTSLIDSGDLITGKKILESYIRNYHSEKSVAETIQKVFDERDMTDVGRELIESTTKAIIELNNRGVGLAKKGDFEKSKNIFREALEELPNNITIHLNSIQVMLMDMDNKMLTTKDQMLLDSSIKLVRERDPNNPLFHKLMKIYSDKKA